MLEAWKDTVHLLVDQVMLNGDYNDPDVLVYVYKIDKAEMMKASKSTLDYIMCQADLSYCVITKTMIIWLMVIQQIIPVLMIRCLFICYICIQTVEWRIS